jgi:Zn-dependent peptidase ImmA (M78 family)/transcriptional regulator with XRE-family HTH domain
MTETIAQSLRRAREGAGLSQDAAAKATEINRVLIAYYETGRRKPPLSTITKLARLYGVTAKSLIEGDQLEVADTAADRILFRTAPAELTNEAKSGARRFSVGIDSYLELLHDLGLPPPGRGTSPFPPIKDRIGQREVARLAREVREYLGLGMGPVGNLFRVVDEQFLVFRLPLGKELRTSPSGLFLNHSQAGFCIAVNCEMTFGRQIFTLAHEIGHAFFHSQQTPALISMVGAPVIRERLADAFAGEFLVPGDTLSKLVRELDVIGEEITDPGVVVHLQRHFGVSYAALLVRLRQDRHIPRQAFEELARVSPSRLAQSLGYDVNPADMGQYTMSKLDQFPDRLLRLVRRAVMRGTITRGDAAETLDVSLEEVLGLLEQAPAEEHERKHLEEMEQVAHFA